MSNIREIAKLAGVSTATVSRALSHPEKVTAKTRKKVEDAMNQSEYRPNMMARNFRATKSFKLLVMVPDISNPFFSALIKGVEDAAHKNGYSVLLGDTRDDSSNEQEYINLVETKQADGIIQLTPHSASSKILPEHIPIVNAAGCEDTPYPCVRIDNRAAARAITDHLIELGHKRIGLITGLATNPHTIDRMKGYREALSAANISYEEEIVVEGEFTMASGQLAAQHFTSMDNPPSAIFCMNDNMAIAAIQTLKASGLKVPEDISVVGFDNIEYSKYTDPPLTTISQPSTELGRLATKLLIKLIEEGSLSKIEHILPHELVVRKTVRKYLGE
jgi:LacI family repressor for deo operon, udp, cdd, tsx, nupC, and nupG